MVAGTMNSENETSVGYSTWQKEGIEKYGHNHKF
jgi:hypothetical protein